MKRLLWIASFFIVVGLFFVARDATSWRPQKLEIRSTNKPTFQFSPDGRWLLIQDAAYRNGTLWNWRERLLVRKVAFGDYRFSPDGQFLATAAMRVGRVGANLKYSPIVKISETQSGREMRSFSDPKTRDIDSVLDARWTRDGKKLVVATRYGCRTFEVATGKIVAQWDSKNAVEAHFTTQISNDGQQVVRLLGANSEIRRTDNGQFLRSVPIGRTASQLLGFSPDARQVYSVSGDGKLVHFWGVKGSPRKLELMATVKTSGSQRPHYTRAPGVLAFAALGGLEWRRVPGGQVMKKSVGPSSEPFALAPDERSAVWCDARGQIYRWRLR